MCMKISVTFFLGVLLCISSSLVAMQLSKQNLDHARYIICIDGGGSKTAMQILDMKGQLVALKRNNVRALSMNASSSNINIVGVDGFKKALDDLFDTLFVDTAETPFGEIKKECIVIGGFAGLGTPENLKKAHESFYKKGFNPEQLQLTTDASLGLELIKPRGIVLISGTGSIALGIEDGVSYRSGGFGPLFDTEGNGNSIGMAAIKAALQDEKGYGERTCLTHQIKQFFDVKEVYELIAPLHAQKILPAKVAELAPIVFESAQSNDPISQKIIDNAVDQLAGLILNTAKRFKRNEKIPVAIIGGLFKGYASYIERVVTSPALETFFKETGKSIEIQNFSNENTARVAVLKMIDQLKS